MQVTSAAQALTSGTTATTKTAGNQELGKDEFLSLLVTQLKNQDPLQPMSNTEFVAQLAQFSSVEQLVAVNEGVDLLGLQQLSMSNSQAASMIGREVQIKSDKLQVGEGDTSLSAAFTLAGDAAEVNVAIRDSAGDVVRTIQVGNAEKGETEFEWDCRNDNGVKVAPGTYSMSVEALDGEGNNVSYEPNVRGEVTGVTYDSGYPELNVGNVKASMSDILGVYPVTEVVP